MELKNILAACDHTLLAQTATWSEIQALCDEGKSFGTASVCIPPCFVKRAKDYVAGKLPICTVIGFPNGYNTTQVKCFEAGQAVLDGADEIDMVVNLGLVKEGNFRAVEDEIKAVKEACRGKLLKVIIETCLLTEEEKVALCHAVSNAKADFIKTSTGFSTGGATVADVALFKANVSADTKIKAAGGIKTLADAEAMLRAGAHRLGTSRVVKLAKAQQ